MTSLYGMASSEDRANKHLPKAFVETYKIFKKLTGIPNETQFVLSTSLHNAFTNSKQVCFGAEWVDSAIPENFHGFGTDIDTVQSMNQFVIGHEVGHLSVQPHWGVSWRKEIRSWPINLSRQSLWSNVYSDVLVNTHIFKSRDWTRPPKNEEEEKISELMEWSQRWHMSSRICKNTAGHAQLRAAGTVIDNRFTPAGGVIGSYSPHEPSDTFTPVPGKTPLYQIRTGHGRGFQVYPPISYALAKGLPAKFRTVHVPFNRNLFECTTCDEVMTDIVTNGDCPRCKNTVNPIGSIAAGNYEVTKAIDLEGKVNNALPTFGHYYIIDGKKVPAFITQELCPDCMKDSSCDITSGFSTFTDYITGSKACSERSTLWRILVIQEYAGFRALTKGYRRKNGFAAGHQFIDDMVIVAHNAETECLISTP